MSADRVWLDPAVVVPLVRAAQESADPAHVERLLDALRPMLMRRLGRGQSLAVAEDLVQIALFKIARSYADMRPAESVATGYLVRLVRNVLLDHARASRRAQGSDAKARTAGADASSGTNTEAAPRAVELRELAIAMRQAVERLPSANLRAVVLGYLRELTPEEIGEELGITADNVRVRWARAKRLLRSDLASVASDWGVIRPSAARGEQAQQVTRGSGRVARAEASAPNERTVGRSSFERTPGPERVPSEVREVG